MERRKPRLLPDLREDLRALIGRKPGAADFARALLLKREFHIMLLYRVSRLLCLWRLSWLATLCQRLNILFFSIEISYKIDIAPGFKINHGVGTVIGDADIRENVIIFQNVTIGTNYPELTRSKKEKGYPVIEENVVIFPGAVIAGPITIGRGSVIGPNAVVTGSLAPGSIVSVPRAQVVGSREAVYSVARGAP